MAAQILMCGEGGSNLELYRASLEDEGYGVQVLEDPEVVDAALAEGGVDLVLLDLPAVDAAACSRVEAIRGGGAGHVIVVVKGAPDPEAAEALRAAGVDRILKRPFSMTKLARSVSTTLEGGRLAEAARSEVARPVSAPGRPESAPSQVERARFEGLQARVESLKALMRRKDQEIQGLREDLKGAHEAERAARGGYDQAIDSHRRAREAAEAEARKLLEDLEERSQRHARQLQLLETDDQARQQGFEAQVQALQQELQELRSRYQAVLHEREELSNQLAEGLGSSKGQAEAQAELNEQVRVLSKEREELSKRLETETRRHANEIKVLVRERKKLVDENHTRARDLAQALEDERAARKQLQLEFEGLKADLPQERRKVSALVDYQRSLTENVLAGILTVDTSGIITLGNELAGQFLEVNLSEILGAHVDQSEAFAPLRPLFAEALAGGRAGPVDFDIRPGVPLRAQATKVPFGPRELVLLSVIGPDRVEVAPAGNGMEMDEGPLAQLGASVAGNITDVQDFAVEIRGCLERLYGATTPESPAREEVNDALKRVGEMIDFLRDIIEQAESYLS